MSEPIELTISPPAHKNLQRAAASYLTFDVGGPGPYRLHRHDARNIVLQRRNLTLQWVTIAFCGNNPHSIARVVLELATEHWQPADGDCALADQVTDLCRAIEALEMAIGGIANEL